MAVDREPALKQLESRLNVSRELLLPYFNDHPLHHKLERGDIDPAAFLSQVMEHLDGAADLSVAELREIHGASFARMEQTIRTIEAFRPNLQVILLSNTNAIDIPFIEDQFGLISWADDAILSYQVGMRKPDTEIYKYALEHYHLDPEKTLFIDDKSENTEAAQAAGIPAARYQSATQVQELLKQLINPG